MNKASLATLASLTFTAMLYAESSYEREMAALEEQHNKDMAAALTPIEGRYQASLEQLMQRATQIGDLDTALKVKEKLAALKTQEEPTKTTVNDTEPLTKATDGLANRKKRHG